ncbi:MAG TPA: TonB family protein [Terriglobales bacterium]|nr:TonB family protein [Terriglobales bacterium]
MSQRVDIFDIRESWKGPITASIAFHGAIVAAILAYGAYMGFSRNEWGSGERVSGEAISATLVGASAIPLPREQPTENIVANESQAVTHSQPKELAPPVPEAVKIPETVKVKPKEKPRQSVEKRPEPVQQATNQVQYGQGGQVHQNFTTFSSALGVGAVAMTTGGDFGSRYAYYVRQVAQLLSQNWLKYEVDPHAMPNASVAVAFDISRDGSPSNVRITQSSGIPSLDTSAVRTLQRIDSFGPLPSDYRGGSVGAEFEFRYTPIKR